MNDALLTVLKFCFLALVYLFLLRVVRVTVLELRTPIVASRPASTAAPADKRERGKWRLELLEPTARRGEVVVLGEDVTIGRGGGCAIALPDDQFVSQVHARVYQQNGKLWLEDLASTNGTFHNSVRVTGAPVRLKRGDRVQFGQTVAQVAR